MIVVVDTGVLVAGVFWRHEPHRVLRAWLRGLLVPAVSNSVFAEYERVLEAVKVRENLDTDLEPWMKALRISALWISPVPLKDPVCRDPADDKFIELALASRAETIIARDADLTVLRKPFGINIVTPRQWLSGLPRAQRRLLD